MPDRELPVSMRVHGVFSKRVSVSFPHGTQCEPGLTSFRQAVRRVGAELGYWRRLVPHRVPWNCLTKGVDWTARPDRPMPTGICVIALPDGRTGVLPGLALVVGRASGNILAARGVSGLEHR